MIKVASVQFNHVSGDKKTNLETIREFSAKASQLKVDIICGAANNQLMDNSCAQDLYKRNIIYIPDFVINRMGIVNCANENYGRLDNDPDINKHYSDGYKYSLPNTIKNITNIQNEKKINLHEAANILSDKYILHKHPIFPDRANNIIDKL